KNGDFSAGANDWTLGTGWSIENGRAVHTGGTAAYLSQGTPTANKTYVCNIDVESASSTDIIQVYLGQSPHTITITSPGVYSVTAKGLSGPLGFAIRGAGECSINSFSIRELDYSMPLPAIQTLLQRHEPEPALKMLGDEPAGLAIDFVTG